MKKFKNKILLITGGTGSFGSEALNQFIKSDVDEIRILSRDEKKQYDLRNIVTDKRVKFFLGDVRDINGIDYIFNGVDFVFHAAALKQVPSCEFHPMEAVRTNIIGTENVMNLAVKHNVKRVILLSTDKAVYPINVMGISKAMMEKLMLARAFISNKKINKTVFCATRFGNVMTSRGSVIPLFINQIKKGLPLTITNPVMTRFLFSLKDSIKLVLHAFENGSPGDIFVQKGPASTIEDLASALKEIFLANNPNKIIGVRSGEKLYETLISQEEMKDIVDEGSYYKISAKKNYSDYDNYFTKGEVFKNGHLEYTSHNTKILNVKELKKVLLNEPFVKDKING
jgi:UDP-N-acetylglucosamine 4,6-dehydratase